MAKKIDELITFDPQTIGMSPMKRWCFVTHRWLMARKPSKRKAPFENIMNLAHDLAERNPKALHDLVKLILRPIQASAMIGVVESADHEAPREIDERTFFFEDRCLLADEYQESDIPKDQFRVRLSTDVVLPCPWNRQRLINALAGIGMGKACGPWTQDFGNHFISLWLPWGIAFVSGGNHSLTAGIIAGEGELIPEAVYDMSTLLQKVHCDGRRFRETYSGRVIATVSDPRIAAVFEIGRLMQANGVTPNRYHGDAGTALT